MPISSEDLFEHLHEALEGSDENEIVSELERRFANASECLERVQDALREGAKC